MDKKRVLFICSMNDTDTQLRIINEIGVIEPLLLSGEKRDEYDFIPRLGVRSDFLTKTIIGNKTSASPFILHFSLHGNEKKGLKLVGTNQTPCYRSTSYFEDVLAEMALQNKKIKCVLFNVCHSYKLAECVASCVDYVIGVQGTIDDIAAVEFSRGFYTCLFDNSEDIKTFENCFRFGQLYVRTWMRDENITIEDGGLPYDKRFHLFLKS